MLAHLPYCGSAPALQDLAAGHIPVMFDPVQSPLPQIRAGRVRALAVSGQERSPALPDIPSMVEAGLPDLTLVAWWAVVAPAGTPAQVVVRLATEIARIAAAPDWSATLGRQGISPMVRGPEEMAAFLHLEVERWGRAVRLSGAK